MIPAIVALGLGAKSAADLIKQIYQANTDPSPKDIEKAIDNKAIGISRQNGIPVDQVKAQIREDTIKEMKADREFKWGDAAVAALMGAPGIGLAAKGIKAGMAAKSAAAGWDAVKGVGAVEAATGGLYKGKPAAEAAAKTGPAAKDAGTTVKNSTKAVDDAAEYGAPAMVTERISIPYGSSIDDQVRNAFFGRGVAMPPNIGRQFDPADLRYPPVPM